MESFSIPDFIMGILLVNALPHFIIGIFKIRFLSIFGFSPQSNIFYSFLCIAISLALFQYQYGLNTILDHGVYAGGLFILFNYYLLTKVLYKHFHLDHLEKHPKD